MEKPLYKQHPRSRARAIKAQHCMPPATTPIQYITNASSPLQASINSISAMVAVAATAQSSSTCASALMDGRHGELRKCGANHTPLTPLVFLERAAAVYADQLCLIYDDAVVVRRTWGETFQRCACVAWSLNHDRGLGLHRGDVVSVLAPNVPAVYELHFAIPMAACIINAINTRLDARSVAHILQNADARLLFVDHELLPKARDALQLLRQAGSRSPHLVLIDDDDEARAHESQTSTYESLVRGAPEDAPALYHGVRPRDEWESIAVNYTSGTTSAPKGVVYSHRGAYLSSLSMLLLWDVSGGAGSVYLWTLPMFHCNGWALTWALALRGAASVCLRSPAPVPVLSAIAAHGVTHMCCAPVVFNSLLNHPPGAPLPHRVAVITGGAPPAPAIIMRAHQMGFDVTHAYGLTEATGPALVCEWRPEWAGLPQEQQAQLKRRQGVAVACVDAVRVGETGVPLDGATTGEILVRGGGIMKGYLGDPTATADALSSGWLRTGDVGVVHPDGYVEIRDRCKDVIISGGENISSVQVESTLYEHADVAEVAVVGVPHPHWGETPCAVVKLKPGSASTSVSASELTRFCRERLPHYMVPSRFVFYGPDQELPKNATGKILKHVLRQSLASAAAAASSSTRPRRQVGQSGTSVPQVASQYAVEARSRL